MNCKLWQILPFYFTLSSNMKFSLNDNLYLSKVITSLAEVVDFVNIECREEGITMISMDPQNVCLVSMHLHAGGFESYVCEEEQVMGLNIGFLRKVIGRICERSSVEMSSSESDDEVDFVFRSHNNKATARFTFFLMTIDDDSFDIPDLHYTSSFKIPSTELKKICTPMAQFGDTLIILVKVDEIRFSVRGATWFGSTSIRRPLFPGVGRYGGVVINCSTEVVQKLPLEHMISIAKAATLSKDVSFTLSSEGPIRIEYRMGDLGHIRFYLAPKIDED